ncbi:cysteine desulfurase [Seminavis robusta]|uniref:Cysteine desulfurase n=1 Tax=Seminavis robusta TaxID=568900 RepID=A0A9N8HSM6_9STRA|nr:cysteine desulfurase [Seminavis robusta]|eukprot:Sro1542_g281020.1 cysteine desulfurase (312) ;mRNA; f:4309-5244
MRVFTALLVPFTLLPRSPRRTLLTSVGNKAASTKQQRVPKAMTRRSMMSSSSETDTPVPPRRIIQFNHAGASPSPPSVVEAVLNHMKLEQTLGGYTAAEMANLPGVYQSVARLLHLPSNNCQEKNYTYNPTHEIALVESATVAWTRLFYSMVQYQHQRQPQPQPQPQPQQRVILVSEAEYAANVVAACQWAKDHSRLYSTSSSNEPAWTVLSITSSKNKDGTSTGCVDLEVLQQMFRGKYNYRTDTVVQQPLDPATIAMVCITHIPTNSGIVNDVEAIGQVIAQHNGHNNNNTLQEVPSCLYLIDACQSAG